MKCPNCGKDVPEGHMYCESCGTEIKIVPEFDPEVENRISETLSDMADSINPDNQNPDEEKQFSENEPVRRRILKVLRKVLRKFRRDAVVWMVLGLAAIAASLCFIVLHVPQQKTAQYYVSLAETASSHNNYNEAIADLEQAYQINEKDSAVIFLLATYQMKLQQPAKAVAILQRILNSAAFNEDETQKAYEEMIKIYESQEDYAAIHTILQGSQNDKLMQEYAEYLPEAPSFSVAGGNYEDKLSVELKDSSDGTVYYTINGDTPTAKNVKYDKAISLDESGDYLIQAVLINSYGISSDTVSEEYHIALNLPAAPQVMEKSGIYTQDTMIVAVADAGCTIFYTTDKSTPTMKSKQYVSPISMPYGDSTFKFAAYDSKGNASKITSCSYHLSYPKQITEDQAIAAVISALMQQDVLLDAKGKVRGLDGKNVYVVDSVINVADSGEYYAISEYHEYNNGSREKTNYMYAVSTQTGAVSRMSYDSSGKYFLVNMAR